MNRLPRIIVAILILLSGLALLPFVYLPTEAFGWQNFAGAYTPPTLFINHNSGKPGSIFVCNGAGFAPNSSITIQVNFKTVGTVTSDGTGNIAFLLDTTGDDVGPYLVTANTNARVMFTLSDTATIHSASGSPLFNVPNGALKQIFLPLIAR